MTAHARVPTRLLLGRRRETNSAIFTLLTLHLLYTHFTHIQSSAMYQYRASGCDLEITIRARLCFWDDTILHNPPVGEGSYEGVGDELYRCFRGKQQTHFDILIQQLVICFRAVWVILRGSCRGRSRGQRAERAHLRTEAGQTCRVIVQRHDALKGAGWGKSGDGVIRSCLGGFVIHCVQVAGDYRHWHTDERELSVQGFNNQDCMHIFRMTKCNSLWTNKHLDKRIKTLNSLPTELQKD